MPLYKFDQSDVFHNRIEANPDSNLFFYSGSAYYNKRPQLQGAFVSSVPGVLPGHISLYEINVDRVSGSATAPDIIYPFIYKSSNNERFRSVDITTLDGLSISADEVALPGDLLTGSYPMSASIVKDYLASGHAAAASTTIDTAIDAGTITPNTEEFGAFVKSSLGSKAAALKNTLNEYTYLSPHYAYDSASYPVVPNEIVNWNKAEQEMGLISIPSIFYGREIKKGTVSLKFYITGTLVGELQDPHKNGELIQVGPVNSSQSGSTAGVVLYNEGFILLTGSWDLTAAGTRFAPVHTENYIGPSATSPRWIDFAQTIATGSVDMPSSSFEMNFKGTNYSNYYYAGTRSKRSLKLFK